MPDPPWTTSHTSPQPPLPKLHGGGKYQCSPAVTGEDTTSTKQCAFPQVTSEPMAKLECHMDLGLGSPCSSPWAHSTSPYAVWTAWSWHSDKSWPWAFKSSNSTGQIGTYISSCEMMMSRRRRKKEKEKEKGESYNAKIRPRSLCCAIWSRGDYAAPVSLSS